MSEDADKPRWQYRLDNFARADVLLREGIDALNERGLSQLEREGVIRRFAYTWKLAWRTIADYLAFEGLVVSPVTPRAVIRAAFERGAIGRGAYWMSATDARNKMSHTYNFNVFEAVIEQIRSSYPSLFDELYDRFTARALGI